MHAARVPPIDQTPVSPPIHPSVTWGTGVSAEIGRLLEDEIDGYVYGRYDNPTATALHAQVAALHETEAAWSTASGTAAVHAALSVARERDGRAGRVLADHRLYGGTHALLERLAATEAWGVDRADLTDPDTIATHVTAEHAVVYLETIANPTMVVADLDRVVKAAAERDLAVVVDNTLASPWLCRPSTIGATLVLESATKLLGGHGDVVAGVVAGPRDLIAGVREVVIELGANIGPFDAWLVSRGIQTLALRAERSGRSAAEIAAVLDEDETVQAVHHPSLEAHPSHERARQLFADRGYGSTLAVDFGSRRTAEAFADACEVFTRAVSLGGTHSLVAHAASTTHRQLDDDDLRAAGIGPGLVRLSVGIEDPADLVADVRQALRVARGQNDGEAATREKNR